MNHAPGPDLPVNDRGVPHPCIPKPAFRSRRTNDTRGRKACRWREVPASSQAKIDVLKELQQQEIEAVAAQLAVCQGQEEHRNGPTSVAVGHVPNLKPQAHLERSRVEPAAKPEHGGGALGLHRIMQHPSTLPPAGSPRSAPALRSDGLGRRSRRASAAPQEYRGGRHIRPRLEFSAPAPSR